MTDSRSDIYTRDNTELLNAVIDNNIDRVIDLINRDSQIETTKQEINIANWRNTPLLLAIKIGNLKMALAILQHPNVDINIADSNGMRPIHWACFFRMDSLIEELLKKSPNVFIEKISSIDSFKYFNLLLPNDFYINNLCLLSELHIPNRIYEHSGLIIPRAFIIAEYNFTVLERNISVENMNDIQKRKFLHNIERLFHLPLHSVAFHIDLIYKNLHIADNNLLEKIESPSNIGSNAYRHNFYLLYDAVRNQRNSITCQPAIVDELASLSSKQISNKIEQDKLEAINNPHTSEPISESFSETPSAYSNSLNTTESAIIESSSEAPSAYSNPIANNATSNDEEQNINPEDEETNNVTERLDLIAQITNASSFWSKQGFGFIFNKTPDGIIEIKSILKNQHLSNDEKLSSIIELAAKKLGQSSFFRKKSTNDFYDAIIKSVDNLEPLKQIQQHLVDNYSENQKLKI